MTDITTAAPPLTRRQAREIERRTGERPVATPFSAAPAPAAPVARIAPAAPAVYDTARIEPNDKLALVSVLPTEVIDRVAERPAPAAAPALVADSAFVRSTSVRAPRPVALVARARRRTTVGFGVAASAAVLATAAIAVPGLGVAEGDQSASQGALVTGDTVAEGDSAAAQAAGAQADTATVPAPAADLVAAPEEAPQLSDLSVTSFGADEVEEVAVETASTGDDSAASGEAGATTSTNGGGDLSGIGAIAQSMMGGGAGWLCTDFTAAVYAEVGIDLPGLLVSGQAAGGTQTSNPQVGDLVVFNSGHIGIYAGGNMMWDNPGYASPNVGWQNVHRSMDVIGSGYYFVTYR
ncbi:MAG: NlpC/P60 family protein [Pseudoclavibacter sp.]